MFLFSALVLNIFSMSAQTYIDCYAPAKTYYDTCKHAVVLLPGAVYNCSTGNKIPQRDIANFKGIIIADTTWQLAGYTVGLNYKGTYVEQSVTGNTFPEYFRLKMAECTYNKFL